MYILVKFSDPTERAALCAMLRTWMDLSCVSLELVTSEAAVAPHAQVIVFWDLDSPEVPPSAWQRPGCALFLCSRDSRRAIDSYSFHPTGFLEKPVAMEQLWRAMHRCARLWFAALSRLEVFSDRVRIGSPLRNLICVEAAPGDCGELPASGRWDADFHRAGGQGLCLWGLSAVPPAAIRRIGAAAERGMRYAGDFHRHL